MKEQAAPPKKGKTASLRNNPQESGFLWKNQ